MTLADFLDTRSISSAHRTSLNLKKRLAVWQTRRALAELDSERLKDVGISSEEARREARLSVWDVPDSWTTR